MTEKRIWKRSLVTGVAVSLLPFGAWSSPALAAQASEATITGIARDADGKALPYVNWDIQTLENGQWISPLQFGPRLTDERGRFTWDMPLNGKYRVCFADTYYGPQNASFEFWQPEVRHRDTCWPNSPTVEGAQTWTPTAASPAKTFTVTLPEQGLGMAPVEPFFDGTFELDKPVTVVGLEAWRPTNATLSYQWFSRGDGQPSAPIAGATTATFTPTSAHANRWLWAEVTATRPGYKPATMGTPTTQAGGTAHVQITSPLTITGTAAAGNTLTASYGKPANTYGEISWYVDGLPQAMGFNGDTNSSTFDVTAAHAGATVEARLRIYGRDGSGNYVDGSDAFHRTQTTVAGQRPMQPLPPAAAPAGASTVGTRLTAPASVTADANATHAYQWMQGSTPIAGATARTYTVRAADIGKPVTVRVTVTRPGWWDTYVTTSKPRVAQGAIKAGTVSVKGTARAGRKLTVRATGWGPRPIKLSYRWLRNGQTIKGATKSTYRLSAKDRGRTIKVRVTATKSRYATLSKSSRGVKVRR